MKATGANRDRWTDTLWAWTGRINIANMTFYQGNLQTQGNPYQNNQWHLSQI